MTVRRFLLLALLLPLAGCLDARVAAFGDSVTFGWGGLPGGWVSEVSVLSGTPMADLGVPGETTAGGAKRINGPFGLWAAPFARTVIILEGGNDANGLAQHAPCYGNCDPSVDEAQFEKIGDNLRSMRMVAAQFGRRVVFATYWPPSRQACSNLDDAGFATWQAFLTRVNQEIVTVAAENDDPVVHLDDLTDLPDFADNYFDCLHPSPLGYTRIALRWMEDVEVWDPDL